MLGEVEEEQVAEQTFRQREPETEHGVRSLRLRAALPGPNTKPAPVSKRVRGS